MLLHTEQLTKNYGRISALDHLDLTVKPGEIVGLLGPNGSGKSTALRMMLGFLKPSAGHASIGGHDCWQESLKARRQVAYLPGELRLYENMTGRQLVQFLARLRAGSVGEDGMPGLSFDGRAGNPTYTVEELAQRFDLDLDRPLAQMSSGMKRKAALLQVLLPAVPLLILDEPTNTLDPVMRDVLLAQLLEARKRGQAVLFSSHVLTEVEQICDRVAILRQGKLVHMENMSDVLAKGQGKAPEVGPSSGLAEIYHYYHGGRLDNGEVKPVVPVEMPARVEQKRETRQGAVLVWKLLRDLRVGLVVICLLLLAFEFLHCKSTEQAVLITRKLLGQNIVMSIIIQAISEQDKMFEKLIGGTNVAIGQGQDTLSIGYVHPLLLIMLSIWAVGRAAAAIAGELDKGTMELLLAQPLPRWRLIASHFVVDCLTIPLMCGCLWAGTALGCYAFGLAELTASDRRPVNPLLIGPALIYVGALQFAISGYTMALSAAGRFRPRVLGIALVATLVQFLINLLGQAWPTIDGLRPWTVFYYYQPQTFILGVPGAASNAVGNAAMLLGVGAVGYAVALGVFCRRDLPAPL